MLRIVRAVVLLTTGLAGMIGGIGALDSTAVVAQERPASKPKASKKAEAAKSSEAAASGQGTDAEAALDKARRALAEGKTDTAVGLADSVLVSASKDARNTARALAVRGEGRFKQGRTAEAIADLENALWVKGGLAGAEREAAVAARAQALQQAGLAANPPPGSSGGGQADSAASAPPRTKAAAGKAAAAASPPAPEPIAREPLRPWDSSVPQVQRPRPAVSSTDRGTVVASLPAEAPVQAAPSRPAPIVAAPVPPPARAAPPPAPPPPFATQTQAAPAPAYVPPPVAAVPAPRPEPQKPAAAESTGGIGSFFGGLFGGGSQKSADEAPQTTATVPRQRPTQPSVSSSPPQRGDDSYAARSPEAAARPVRAASVVVPPPKALVPAPPAAATPEGAAGYKIQLAAVRSKEEAQAMAQSVRRDEAALSSREYEIVEDTYGNMGRFYRVRIGGFAPTEAMSVCTTLRRKQLDCMVLDR